ncbi:hypothetical protein Skr01_36560 [Sphaerisporangium krabiense]|uniref:Uncharacterized protein n=1 Tax=Sphaerisporangium krabiense TaxID=763782 RepID=A0A7W8Z3C8_9ACTN|nr:hypothetical protein [Sphaerisporangium krabiense]MBB5626651.1 hypothetical protein [Sphaerisporangium krabiense]GII63571.1 hypothetical protein Skr01_36560 [Sphaerisporangium krabiense]
MAPDLTNAMRTLAGAASSNAHERVYVWRQVLTALYRQGVDDGYHAAMHDRSFADLLDDREAEARGEQSNAEVRGD